MALAAAAATAASTPVPAGMEGGFGGVLRGFLFYSSEEEKLSGKRCQPEGREGEKPSLSFSAPARNYQERGRKERTCFSLLSFSLERRRKRLFQCMAFFYDGIFEDREKSRRPPLI